MYCQAIITLQTRRLFVELTVRRLQQEVLPL